MEVIKQPIYFAVGLLSIDWSCAPAIVEIIIQKVDSPINWKSDPNQTRCVYIKVELKQTHTSCSVCLLIVFASISVNHKYISIFYDRNISKRHWKADLSKSNSPDRFHVIHTTKRFVPFTVKIWHANSTNNKFVQFQIFKWLFPPTGDSGSRSSGVANHSSWCVQEVRVFTPNLVCIMESSMAQAQACCCIFSLVGVTIDHESRC